MTYTRNPLLALWSVAGLLVLVVSTGCDTNANPDDYTFACAPSESGQCGEGYECTFDPNRDTHVCVPDGTTFDVGEDTTDASPDTGDTTEDTQDTEEPSDVEDTSDVQDDGDAGCQSSAVCADGEYCDTATGECLVGCETDNDCVDGEFCSQNECITEEPPCLVGEPPGRCDTSSEPQWGGASVVYEITVAGYDPVSENFDETACCFDFDADGDDDNGYGSILKDFGTVLNTQLATANSKFADRIGSGALRLAFEYQGLESLNQEDNTFRANVYQSQMSGPVAQDGSTTNPLTVTSLNFEQGTYYPKWSMLDGQYVVNTTSPRTSRLVSGPGKLRIFLPFLVDLEVELLGARIDAIVPASPESTTGNEGVYLEQGKLSGYVPVFQIYDALNDTARGCSCLGLGINEDLITYNPNDLTDADAIDCEEPNTSSCTDDTCISLGNNCGLLASVMPALADYDADNDSKNDSMTVGLRFSAAGAFVESASTN